MSLETFHIRLANTHEIATLPKLEMNAGERFRTVGMAHVADAPPLTLDPLNHAHNAARLWVIEGNLSGVVGFAMADILDGHAHLDEVSVTTTHGGLGLGRRLIAHVRQWATAAGYTRLTLTTFRDVPWNAPYYRRLGFKELEPAQLGPELNKVVIAEKRRGLLEHLRIVMGVDLKTTTA